MVVVVYNNKYNYKFEKLLKNIFFHCFAASPFSFLGKKKTKSKTLKKKNNFKDDRFTNY